MVCEDVEVGMGTVICELVRRGEGEGRRLRGTVMVVAGEDEGYVMSS